MKTGFLNRALICMTSALLLTACQNQKQSSADSSPGNARDAQSSQPAVMKAPYVGEAFEIEVATDDMLQILAGVKSPARVAVAVQMNRLNGSINLTTATTGRVTVKDVTESPIELTASPDGKFLYADISEPVAFPVQAAFSLTISGEHARTVEHAFTIARFSERDWTTP